MDINKALKKVGSTSYAHILPDNRIEYIKIGNSTLGRSYKMKVPLSKLTDEMYGEDIRFLKLKYGRK